MIADTLASRDQIETKYKWNASSVFESVEAWELEFEEILGDLVELDAYRGHLSIGPARLADFIDTYSAMKKRVGKIAVCALMSHQVDVADQDAARMFSQAQGLWSQAQAATAFLDPELINMGRETLQEWMEQEPRLAILAHYLADLFRKQAHVRSSEVEELMGMLSAPFAGTSAMALT